MIQRDHYLNKLKGYRDKKLIKVVTGIRRCGKSTLLTMFRDYLLDEGVPPGRVLSVNLEDMLNAHLRQPEALHEYILQRLDPAGMNYIILDEIQNVADFPRVVDSLFLRENADIYMTGSNAYMLSGEIATLLSGRYVEISMLPLSFKEYVGYIGDGDLGRKYSDYLQYSSFPLAVQLDKDADQVREYLSGIYSTVVLKDVVGRNRIADVMMLESVIQFLYDNIGNLLSTKRIADTMTSGGRKISTHTVESYVSALVDSFIIYRAKRYEIKGRQYLKTNDKYYAVDIGLRYFLLGNRGADSGRMLENVIYLELLRRGFDVYVGIVGKTEVDFIAMKGGTVEYYQVADTVREQSTLQRELRPLLAIDDHYPKYLLSRDEDPEGDYKGIRRINALDWLLM